MGRARRILLSLLLPLLPPTGATAAQTQQNPDTPFKETSAGTVQNVVSSASESRANRAHCRWTVLASYSYLDLWVPSKLGLGLAYNASASQTYEIGYMRAIVGGYDYLDPSIGRISDERLTAGWRYFSHFNSFNAFVGAVWRSYRARLQDDLLKSIPAARRGESGLDHIGVATLGAAFAVGNRWQTEKGFVWSFDWLTIELPLRTLSSHHSFLDSGASPSATDRVDHALRNLRDHLAGTLVKVQLGYTF
jgi:hypothetical protein